MLLDLETGKQAEIQKKGEYALNLRKFTVECLTKGECLILHSKDLD
jgi:hypothetical protein